MRDWINLTEGKLEENVSFMVPDIGTIIEVDDPHQWNDGHGLTKGKRTYVVKSWLKAAPEPKFDLDDIFAEDGDDADFHRYMDHLRAGASDALGDIVDQSARRFNDGKRLMWCTREEAEYLSCGGKIIKVGEGKIMGRVNWSPEIIS